MAIVDRSRRMFLLSMFLYLQYTKAQKGPCLQEAPVLDSCSGQLLTGQEINVYHTNLQNLKYSTTCRCTVTGNQRNVISIQVTNVPEDSCGTNISIFEPRGSIKPIPCTNPLRPVSPTSLRANDSVRLVFSTVAYSTSPAFCIYIHGSFGPINVECSSRIQSNVSHDSLSSTNATTTEIAISTETLESKGVTTSKTDETSTTSNTDEISITISTITCSGCENNQMTKKICSLRNYLSMNNWQLVIEMKEATTHIMKAYKRVNP